MSSKDDYKFLFYHIISRLCYCNIEISEQEKISRMFNNPSSTSTIDAILSSRLQRINFGAMFSSAVFNKHGLATGFPLRDRRDWLTSQHPTLPGKRPEYSGILPSPMLGVGCRPRIRRGYNSAEHYTCLAARVQRKSPVWMTMQVERTHICIRAFGHIALACEVINHRNTGRDLSSRKCWSTCYELWDRVVGRKIKNSPSATLGKKIKSVSLTFFCFSLPRLKEENWKLKGGAIKRFATFSLFARTTLLFSTNYTYTCIKYTFNLRLR